jgi:hypothetical protein
MQTEAGWKGLRLRPDIVGTEDGLAKYPYIRESRRIQAELTVLEQHVGTDARMQIIGNRNHHFNGFYRLHPVEWNVGESAGLLAAEAIRTGEPPRRIRNNEKLRKVFQARIQAQGVEIQWPTLTAR